MATIRVRDWTKEQIERIRDAESHSSHDSVIKSLLKDRKLAKYADDAATPVPDQTPTSQATEIDTAFEDLTVLAELTAADNGVLFLWCPNCGSELAHMTADSPVGLSVFEMECQRCLTHLDQHAIVVIEIGYPIEQKLVDNDLEDDLKNCVVDYWDRRLNSAALGGGDDDVDSAHLVWQFDQYLREFAWEWPTDVPAVGFEADTTFHDTATDDYIDVLEPVTENRNAVDSFKIRRYTAPGEATDGDTEILDSTTITEAILDRRLEITEQSAQSSRVESTDAST